MSEPPGAGSALGIEAVEWLAEGGENLTVRVTGRWRRRRPALSAQPTLVIEATGRRYRFPAIAEPPSLSGAGPGTWRISFAVPATLAPELGGRAWLQFGSVIVPLPAAVSPPALRDDEVTEPVVSAGAAEGAPGSEVAPGGPSATLQTELAQARAEVSRLAALLADEQLSRRAAEQGARAERSLRADLHRQLRMRTEEAERGRQAGSELTRAQERLARLTRTEERVQSLERELAEARERIRQAEAAAAAAAAAQAKAEHALAAATRRRLPEAGQPPPAPQLRHLTLEHDLTARPPGPGRIPAEPLPFLAAPMPAAPAVPMTSAGGAESPNARAMTEALRQELAGRAVAEAGLRSRLVEAETRLAARQMLEQRTNVVLGELRQELDGLREALTREKQARRAAEARADRLGLDLGGARSRTQEARDAIAEIRNALDALRNPDDRGAPSGGASTSGPRAAGRTPTTPTGRTPSTGGATPPSAAGRAPSGGGTTSADRPPGAPVQPERLNQALLRLREQIGPQEPVSPSAPSPPSPPASAQAPADLGPVTVGRAWLRDAFRALARDDPDRAGRLVLDLLPAQRAVYPRPIAYDLELGGDFGCLRVTVSDGSQKIVPSDSPRGPGDVAFRFAGEPAELGRRLRAGRLRRLWRRGLGRVYGQRSALAALDALVGTQLGLGALHTAGVRLEPRTALALLARLISPAWIDAERFTLAYGAPGEPPVFLIIGGNRPIEVTENRPTGPATTTVAGPAGTLELVLCGDPAATATAVSGDPRPVRVLGDWLKHAQSG